MIRLFDSPNSLAEAYRTASPRKTRYRSHVNPLSWFGNETREQSLHRASIGDASLVPEAEALLSSLDFAIETPRKEIHSCVAGGWPSVPDTLAGRPLTMRRIVHQPDEHAPITILVMGVSSGAISASILHRRGIGILALVMALARSRPITLKQVATLHGHDAAGETIFVTHINTAPLDLASACWTLASQGFMRRMNYDLAENINGFNGNWPRKYSYGNSQAYLDYVVTLLGYDPATTLVIKPAEANDDLVRRPVQWITEQVNKFITKDEEEY
jgi:hypothetical protein